jgi:hypothetical protein
MMPRISGDNRSSDDTNAWHTCSSYAGMSSSLSSCSARSKSARAIGNSRSSDRCPNSPSGATWKALAHRPATRIQIELQLQFEPLQVRILGATPCATVVAGGSRNTISSTHVTTVVLHPRKRPETENLTLPSARAASSWRIGPDLTQLR